MAEEKKVTVADDIIVKTLNYNVSDNKPRKKKSCNSSNAFISFFFIIIVSAIITGISIPLVNSFLEGSEMNDFKNNAVSIVNSIRTDKLNGYIVTESGFLSDLNLQEAYQWYGMWEYDPSNGNVILTDISDGNYILSYDASKPIDEVEVSYVTANTKLVRNIGFADSGDDNIPDSDPDSGDKTDSSDDNHSPTEDNDKDNQSTNDDKPINNDNNVVYDEHLDTTIIEPAVYGYPTITLKGSNNITLATSDNYSEPGVSAVDYNNNALAVSTSGTVLSGTSGTYSITYSATDDKGQKSTVERTIVISGWNCGDDLYDSRNGQTYETLFVDNICMMKDELYYSSTCEDKEWNTGSLPYDSCVNKDGATYYQWDALMKYSYSEGVQGLCPSGWHVPSTSEIQNTGDAPWKYAFNTRGYYDINKNYQSSSYEKFWVSTNNGIPGSLATYYHSSNQIFVSAGADGGYIGYPARCILGEGVNPEFKAPTITITGSSSITIYVGEGYSDQGATAYDYKFRDLDVEVANEVDATNPGTYKVTYSVEDEFGQTTTKERTVTVLQDPEVGFTCGDIFVDIRDHKSYPTVLYENYCMIRTDLEYTSNGCLSNDWASGNNNACRYQDDGLYYQWSAAMNGTSIEGSQGSCPNGWHVPLANEITNIGGSYLQYYFYEPGYYDTSGSYVENITDYSWTSSSSGTLTSYYSRGYNIFKTETTTPDTGYPVRCLKD